MYVVDKLYRGCNYVSMIDDTIELVGLESEASSTAETARKEEKRTGAITGSTGSVATILPRDFQVRKCPTPYVP